MPLPPAAHGTTNRWRAGCRDCDECRSAHNTDTMEWRRGLAEAAMPKDMRRRLLRRLAKGEHLNDATAALGLTLGQVWGRARRDAEWREALDEALMAGRDPDVPHGTPTGYRRHRCRCPECRAVHSH